MPERNKPSEPSSSIQSNETECRDEPSNDEEQSEIIHTMDAESSVLRQRRLAFYDNQNFSGKMNLLYKIVIYA